MKALLPTSFAVPMLISFAQNNRGRARNSGVAIGVLPSEIQNTITDVPGGHIGHATKVDGSSVRADEAILNLLSLATRVEGKNGNKAEAIPIDRVSYHSKKPQRY